jgi:hypothetical protein
MGIAASIVYEVECQLDPDIVADYDAWLPGHVRDVLACPGFHGASIEIPETPPGERQRRRIRYRVESVAALDHYLENNATRLRTETAQRFGGRVHCERRVFRPRHEIATPASEARRCLNCGTVVSGKHCAQCGQASDVHVLSMKEVAGDVVHSVLHLDSRAWRTLKLLVRRPGELTREFIAGRHQQYLPPFRLYLIVSIAFFALTAILPDSESFNLDDGTDPDLKILSPAQVRKPAGEPAAAGNAGAPAPTAKSPAELKDLTGELRKELEAEGVPQADIDKALKRDTSCRVDLFGDEAKSSFEEALGRACQKMKLDGGKHFAERFAATAPKLMFLFLPLMAGVALLFYWRPRRLYAEHLVLFLHNHAFTFLLAAAAQVLSTLSDFEFPLSGLLGFLAFLLYCCLPFYVYRSMRVVYAEGHFKTLLKFFALSTIYCLLLGFTMLLGLVLAMLSLS